MKKILVLLLVLGIASVANAALLISVDGVVDPPDTEILLMPSGEVIIDIWGDGQDSPRTTTPWLIFEGQATVSGGVMLYTGTLATITLYEEDDGSGIIEWLDSEGYNTRQAYYIELLDGKPDPADPLSGTLVDDILFHGEMDDVLISLVSADLGTVYDTQVIHIPEPMTIALLGLGGLFLLRRRK